MLHRILLVAALLLAPAAATAQDGKFRPGAPITDTNPQPFKCLTWNGTEYVPCSTGGGGGSGGGGDASASNQVAQTNAINQTNARLGDITAPATGSVNARLGVVSSGLSDILVSTNLIGTRVNDVLTSTNLVGTRLGDTSAPAAGTVNARLGQIFTALGSPLQAGGTVNLGTIGGAATAANQGTANGYLQAIAQAAADTTTPVAVSQSGAWTLGQLPTSLGPKAAAASLATVNPKSATATSANVTAAAASTLVLAANVARNGCNIINDSTAIAYVKLGTGASPTSFDYYMAGSVSGVPASFSCPSDWTGAVYAYWATATGAARVSERTN